MTEVFTQKETIKRRIESMPLRAENLTILQLQEIGGAKEVLLASQTRMMTHITDYIFEPTSGPFEYAFYLRGSQGSGKTLTTLYALKAIVELMQNVEKVDAQVYGSGNSEIKISFSTFGVNGNVSLHPDFSTKIDDANVIVLNDLHYHLQAILNGKVEREGALEKLVEIFSKIENRHVKAIVLTDEPLSYYAEKIGDERLLKIVKGSYALESHELITGIFKDLLDISQNLKLGFSEEILQSISNSNRSIRFMFKLKTVYGEKVGDLNKITDTLAEFEDSRMMNAILKNPRIRSFEDLFALQTSKDWGLNRRLSSLIKEKVDQYFVVEEKIYKLSPPIRKAEIELKEMEREAKELLNKYKIYSGLIPGVAISQLEKFIKEGNKGAFKMDSMEYRFVVADGREIIERYNRTELEIIKISKKLGIDDLQIESRLLRANIEEKIWSNLRKINQILPYDIYVKSSEDQFLIEPDYENRTFKITPAFLIGGSFMQAAINGEAGKLLDLKYGQRD